MGGMGPRAIQGDSEQIGYYEIIINLNDPRLIFLKHRFVKSSVSCHGAYSRTLYNLILDRKKKTRKEARKM